MTLNIDRSVVYDIETFPNAFTLAVEALRGDATAVWEISSFRDDRQELMQWFNWLAATQTPMIGFNNLHFDYPVIHFIFNNPTASVEQIYAFAMNIIGSNDRFVNMIWADNRFAPQIDVFKINHFDNPAKSTGLKALEMNMRSNNVVDMPVALGNMLTEEQINNYLIPYNQHDVSETKKFTLYNMPAINFRNSLTEQFGLEVLSWSDTKIGSRMMENMLGKELCYDISSGKRKKRQTYRTRVALADVIFPYIRFNHPEFERILEHFRKKTLKQGEIQQFTDRPAALKTKGVFAGLKATVGGLDFHFGTGGVHGSINAQSITATEDWLLRDIDVASLYPSIAIVNRLAPEHLGQHFVDVYQQLPLERKKWQAKKGKKCVEANTLKLASNGVYGNSNNAYSVFYDPKFTMTITINGQLMLCMLAERLTLVPTLKLIQINTDGITYLVQKDHEPSAAQICKEWETTTALVLEDADYSRMWIRNVNNYIAESPDGSLKLKGAYWTPDALDYHNSISSAQPPAWHKDFGNVVSVRAARAAMIHGVDIERFIRLTTNPYDFMCRIKVRRSDSLFWGSEEIQKNTRYYVSTGGNRMIKRSPPTGTEGTFKRAAKISEAEYNRVMVETGGRWDARVCTKNKSTHQVRETSVQAGHQVQICNDVKDFDFSTVNYDWYINEARKLLV